jgi:adenylate cyclase
LKFQRQTIAQIDPETLRRSLTDLGKGMTAEKCALDDKAKLAALENLLAQPAFRASQRNKNFLRFIVEETLAGRSDRLKAYTIAVDVFGRGVDFDGTLDPVVRIEAGRLRHALARYYAEQGQSERIRIALPRGGYVPLFELTDDGDGQSAQPGDPSVVPAASQDADDPAWTLPDPTGTSRRQAPPSRRRFWTAAAACGLALLALAAIGLFVARGLLPGGVNVQSPIVLVARAHPLTGDAPSLAFANTLSQTLPAAIARFESLTVIAARPDQADGELIAATLAREPSSRRIYLVTTSVRADANGARALWQLLDGRTQSVLWSSTADTALAPTSTIDVETETAQKIARAVASHGAISSLELRAIPTPIPPGYPCVAYAREFVGNLSDSQRKLVADCLEATVAQYPDYAEAWAMLAFIKNDESRARIDNSELAKAALSRAAAAAARAEMLAPFSSLAQMAVAVVAFQQRDPTRFEAAARKAIATNPNDPNLQVIFANRLFASGRYEEAASVLKHAMEIRPEPIATDQVLAAFELYRAKKYPELLQLYDRSRLPNYHIYWLLLAAANGQLGNRQTAAEQIERLQQLRPNYGAVVREDFRNRGFQEDFIDQLADGLRKAGLDVS